MGFSYLLGGYFDVSSPVAYSSNSLNQRFALSYTNNGWGPDRERYLGHPIRPAHEPPANVTVPGIAGISLQWVQPKFYQR